MQDISQNKFQAEYVIYLKQCTIYNLLYVSKNEPPFNIRLSNHRKYVKDSKEILADKHFLKSDQRFNKDARFTIIDRLTNTKFDKEILRECESVLFKEKSLGKKIKNYKSLS